MGTMPFGEDNVTCHIPHAFFFHLKLQQNAPHNEHPQVCGREGRKCTPAIEAAGGKVSFRVETEVSKEHAHR